jgi:hypothetical protein
MRCNKKLVHGAYTGSGLLLRLPRPHILSRLLATIEPRLHHAVSEQERHDEIRWKMKPKNSMSDPLWLGFYDVGTQRYVHDR